MSSKVVPPGRDLIEVARALEFLGRSLGQFPYQWSRPGPNSKPILVNGVFPITGAAGSNPICSFSVPDGMIFSLTGFVVGFFGNGWVEGDGTLLWTLNVTGGVGDRPVDYLRAISVAMGSFTEGPYPIPGRLEFKPGNILTWNLAETGAGPVIGAGQDAYAQIFGHIYPLSEAQ
jgi:hypothetical protein